MASVIYSVLRYIESPVRFEPRNIGVVALDLESGKTDIRFAERMPVVSSKHKDLVAVASASLVDAYNRYLLFVDSVHDEDAFRLVVDQVHGILDATQPRFYETDQSFDAEFGKLFGLLVSRGVQTPNQDVTKQKMVRATDRMLVRFGLLGSTVQKKAKVQSRLTRAELIPDYSWVNGRPNYVLLRSYAQLRQPNRIEELARSTAFMAEELADEPLGVQIFYSPPVDDGLEAVVREIMATKGHPMVFNDAHLEDFARKVQSSVH